MPGFAFSARTAHGAEFDAGMSVLSFGGWYPVQPQQQTATRLANKALPRIFASCFFTRQGKSNAGTRSTHEPSGLALLRVVSTKLCPLRSGTCRNLTRPFIEFASGWSQALLMRKSENVWDILFAVGRQADCRYRSDLPELPPPEGRLLTLAGQSGSFGAPQGCRGGWRLAS